jgi:hypothetical protein
VNSEIFRNIPELMENVERVTRHIRNKLINLPDSDPERKVLTLIPSCENGMYCQDDRGNFWRMYIFIKNSHSCDIVRTTDQAFEGGKAFGKFQASLADIPGGPLHDTIPDFHNIDKRLKRFHETVQSDPANRAAESIKEIAFAEKRADEMRRIISLGVSGLIPMRVTHNDTKFNNVLLDDDERALCIIDLDTVMNGYVHYDFGDSIRTTTNTGAEDENDLDKVTMDIKLFEAYARGFLSETGQYLKSVEIDNLAFSARLMTFTIGLRFLTDYLENDCYFRINYPDQNLKRAMAQFRLLTSMERQYESMCRIIEDISLNHG